MNKICSGCKETKMLTEFNKYKRSKDGLYYSCKACQQEANKAWSSKNWDKKIAQQRERRTDLRLKFSLYKEERGCVICNETDAVCLEFHHLDPTEKEIDPSDMATQGWSWDRMMSEVAKCVILCSNCHRKVHADKICLITAL